MEGGDFPRELTVFNYFGNLWPIGLDGIEWVAILSIGLASPRERDIWSCTGARRRARIYTNESTGLERNVFQRRATIPSVLRCKIKWCSGPSLFRRGQVAATGNYYLRLRRLKDKMKGPGRFSKPNSRQLLLLLLLLLLLVAIAVPRRTAPHRAPSVHPLSPPLPRGSRTTAVLFLFRFDVGRVNDWSTILLSFFFFFLFLFFFFSSFLHRVGWISTVIEDGTIDLP